MRPGAAPAASPHAAAAGTVRRMPELAISAIGRDRPGIVAGLAEVLLDHGLNIADSQMTILGGHFAMTLLVTAPEGADPERLREGLEGTRERLGLDAVTLSPVGPREGPTSEASHIVTVYGVDHPGIVHAVSSLLAEKGVNITDLTTRLVGGSDQPLYAMMMEVALPEGLAADDLRAPLADVGRSQGVEVVLRRLEQDAL